MKKDIILKLNLFIILLIGFACNPSNPSNNIKKSSSKNQSVKNAPIKCTDEFCRGTYKGKEFIKGSDIAHQHSNTMSGVVGDKLKELYDMQKYSKVDFQNITMTTEGMGTGMVEYELKIPFVRVSSKCDAYTSFDHVGGWNHSPELEKRKSQLKPVLLPGDELDISELKTTREGLQEYWIQWRNKDKQKECGAS